MRSFKEFTFKNYDFDVAEKTLYLEYSFDDKLEFSETFKFDFDFVDYDKDVLQAACQTLFYMAGVSYYKAYLPAKIVASEAAPIDKQAAEFFSRTYQRGLGEFFYVNKLDPKTPVNFPGGPHQEKVRVHGNDGLLIGLGGGKDSLVSVELFKHQPKIATWSVGHRSQLEPLVEKVGTPHFWVERTWDKELLQHNKTGAYNGHIPISAILACVGEVVAALTGYRDVVVSNESSASEPNLHYRGVAINHQYSKSLEFERDFQEYLKNRYGGGLRYYSLLRPFSELRIAEMFAKIGFEKYKDVFSSCNRAFIHTSDHMSWCGECPKCAFVFLALTPFIDRDELEKLFSGKNLLLDESLESTYRQLLGIEGDKPLECVGEVKECRSAMKLAQEIYPELEKYKFELPADYDFRLVGPHSMPDDIAKLVLGGARLL